MAWGVASPAEIAAARRQDAARRAAATRRRRGPTGPPRWGLAPGTRGVRPVRPSRGTTYTPAAPAPATTDTYHGMSDEEIIAQAEKDANAALAAKQAAIARQQAAAQAAAARDVAALKGLGEAQTGLLAPIPGQIVGLRNEAGSAIAGFGEGYAKGAGAALAQGQEQTAETTAAEGQAPAPSVDATGAQNAIFAQTGEIPATEQASLGAASGIAAAGMPAVVLRAAAEDIHQRMAEAASEDAQYRAQLLDLAAERPGLVSDALDRLYKIEEMKYGRYAAEQKRLQDERELKLRERAQAAYEKQLGIKNKQGNRRLDISERSLQLRESKQVEDVRKAEKEGRRIDAPASRVAGHLVDRDGNDILDRDGRQIKIYQSPKDKKDQAAKNRRDAISEVDALRGEPAQNPNFGKPGFEGQGQYMGRAGAKGLLPSGTTNDASRAARSGGKTWAQAQSYLMTKYGFSRAKARSILIAAGWKPGG